MNFLNPFFLFGLLAVAIPVIIHLINLQRPKKVAFSTLSFFNELRKTTIRRIRIKQYLLMALRVLALLFLALALARPFLPPTITGPTSSTEPKVVAIVLDNSASMNRIGSRGPLIEQAKKVAGRIIQNANSDDKFYITTTNGDSFSQDRLLDKKRSNEIISDIEPQNSGHYTKERFLKAYQQLQGAPQAQAMIYIISDGQKSQMLDLKDLSIQRKDNAQKPVTIQPISLEKGKQQNVAVSSITLKNQMISQGTPITLAVDVENVGDAAVTNQFVSLEVDGELLGQHEVALEPGESKEFLFQAVPGQTGNLTGRIIIEGDEVDYDNRRYFVVNIPEERSVLLVKKEEADSPFSSYLQSVLEAAKQSRAQLSFKVQQPNQVTPSQWPNYDAIVLDGIEQIPDYWFQDMQRYVQNGNGLLFFPSEKGAIENYNRFLSLFNAGKFTNIVGEYGSFEQVIKMAEIEEGHPVLENVFAKKGDEDINIELPSLYYYYRYRNSGNAGSIDILKATNEDPLLTEQQFGEGVFLISTLGTDPGWSNLPVNPIFAPLYYRSILYASSSQKAGLQKYELGKAFRWEHALQSSDVKLELDGSEYRPKVEQAAYGVRISYSGQEWEPGILTIKAGKESYKIAVNQNILESRFGSLESTAWQEMISSNALSVNKGIKAGQWSAEELDEKLSASMFGQEIWSWFIWLALLFLILETVITRIYKAESVS
ncbi:BatA domain-containing protein [Fodinibius halophilus]|uniref:VWA domain-containing protein n=1 Tax=Fodinibius halophilus TaxID=1736908 RepID=A0A6M1TMI7_9BACT|nr:BatA domain-containing protein [Fodinibius halophilus]NGP89620.1 VWA domain-containing protein [Fodinibius halophilus]